ncbi:hypothetical protein BGS_1190 [Beggiatoa sp. SS]|nr:hypothetical protein BGS_1190 [Beggiatoa sp. SS]
MKIHSSALTKKSMFTAKRKKSMKSGVKRMRLIFNCKCRMGSLLALYYPKNFTIKILHKWSAKFILRRPIGMHVILRRLNWSACYFALVQIENELFFGIRP